MILIVWLAGVTWLAVSTVVASLLGISYSSEEVERGALIAEVLLSLLEANLLMVMVVWCFRERELVYKAGEVSASHDLCYNTRLIPVRSRLGPSGRKWGLRQSCRDRT